MIKRLLPHPVLAATLLLAWVLLMDSAGIGVLLLGLILAVLIARWSTAFWPEPVGFRRPGLLLRFVPLVLWDILVANIAVARLVLGPNRKLRPAFLVIPVELESPHAITAFASIITLTPGTVSAELSEDRRTLYVHALDSADPQADIAGIKQRYEQPLKEIFECSPSR
ncbi:Na+/H+ antiporter subunit E [Alkalilimnicola sp. S0819]|uniref:Na+/H+ antiporter subunit E n=1 Tax=Alkalilimnicola sp. S0819 TaxID=2613922 RepID=UPI0012622DC4|nr:Na+/H+ antiporter subunit E [Alkalilimnicola sp. S0819]KAB7623163.1 Na+/H+ antiporter subunit E [Alkalilimnicola sp. S0819]MPQ17007.1 Na+/H+ antiporter subunit E [Alkalilimnicola sp. S0819]